MNSEDANNHANHLKMCRGNYRLCDTYFFPLGNTIIWKFHKKYKSYQ